MNQKKSVLFVTVSLLIMIVMSALVAWIMSRNYAKDVNLERGKLNRALKEASEKQYVYDEQRGQYVYGQFCSRCHVTNGVGSSTGPSLVGSALVVGDQDTLIAITSKGLRTRDRSAPRTYGGVMPGFPMISNQDLAYVLTFIRKNFTQSDQEITTEDVIKGKLQYIEHEGVLYREEL